MFVQSITPYKKAQTETKGELQPYLDAKISVPELAICSTSGHRAKHVGIYLNDFLYRLRGCTKEKGTKSETTMNRYHNIH